jgi:hypothetical protein
MACKPDSVPGLPPWTAIPLVPPLPGGIELPTRASGLKRPCGDIGRDESRADHARARPLFGIAPGGACRAGPVARPAVGSYPTVSPLPPDRSREADCSLWRFPSGCPGRALPGTVASWSPDFPRAVRFPVPPAAVRPSAPFADRRSRAAGQSCRRFSRFGSARGGSARGPPSPAGRRGGPGVCVFSGKMKGRDAPVRPLRKRGVGGFAPRRVRNGRGSRPNARTVVRHAQPDEGRENHLSRFCSRGPEVGRRRRQASVPAQSRSRAT